MSNFASKAPTIHPCRIIGVLDDGANGLTRIMLDHIKNADLVIGGTRTLKLFDKVFKAECERLDLSGHFMQVPTWISEAQAKGKRVVVLATGDPLCHGIASFLQSRLCIEAFEILPNLSMVQLSCARLGIPWNELKICSVHGKDVGEWDPVTGRSHGLYPILHAAQYHDRLAIFTGPDNSPDRLARLLVSEGLADDFQMAVVEHLMRDSERLITDLSIKQAAGHEFADPNMVLLWRTGAAPNEVSFGLADDSFAQRKPDKGLITKREVRAVSLARMQLRRSSIVWDIGAASGSVGLEAARLAPDGYVYAIEKNKDDIAIGQQNQRAMGVHNYHLILGKAPEGLENWPDPDAVFIGGSGGNLPDLIRLIMARLKPHGTLVMNFVTIENLATATDTLKELGVQWDITQMQISRSKPILNMLRFAAENPVWIISAQSHEEKCHPREGGDDKREDDKPMNENGKLYGVSVGPGDPDLMTKRAYDLLHRDACWTYPVRNSKSESYAFNIVKRGDITPPPDHYPLIFPMTHDEQKLEKFRDIAAKAVLKILRTGQDVMFLVEGDASTYSTFGHLARHIEALDDSIEVETVAGVSSFNAAAARLQFPLAEVDDTVAILPANYGIDTIDQLLNDFDTLVLMKVKPILDEIIDLLEQRGLLQHAAFIEKAGSSDERIFHDVSKLRGETVNYLSLMLVKNPDRERAEISRGCRKKEKTSAA